MVFWHHTARTLLLALALALSLAAVGCGTQSGSAQSDSVTIALGHGMQNLGIDPFGTGRENTVLETAIYEPLVMDLDNGEFEPWLAQSWESADGGKTWIFHLRQNVTFHDGSAFDSAAVRFAFERYLKDPTLSRSLGIDKVETPDAGTVIFRLKRPFAPFLAVVGSFQTVIPSPAGFNEKGEFVKAVGTGPYKVEQSSSELVTLKRHEQHWRGPARLDQVKVKFIADPGTMVMALESGEVDLIGADGYGVPRAEVERLKKDGRFSVTTINDGSSLEWVGFNINRAPLDDLKVRQAINYAIDRTAITGQVLDGYAAPAKGPLGYSDAIPWTNTDIAGYSYDLARAKALLAEAGWQDNDSNGIVDKSGQDINLTLYFDGTTRDWKLVAETLQAQLAQVGIKVTLQSRDSSATSELIGKGDFDMVALASIGKRLSDPYMYFQYYFTSSGRSTMVKGNEKIDGLLNRITGSLDPAARQQAYHQIQQEIMDLAPGAFIYHTTRVTVTHKDLRGWQFAGTMDPLRFIYKLERG